MNGTAAKAVAGNNPFVGPQPIGTGRSLFGRDREVDDLFYLLCARRIVLLYSPSGAGKSSLIRAGLMPRLQKRFDVWGPTRVNLPVEVSSAAVNRYVRSALLGFEQDLPAERGRKTPEEIAGMTLSEYVAGRRDESRNIVLIFDQFEEILTADPLAIEAKKEFFRQLGDLLLDPHVWALFALREDYLAPLDPYADQVPTHLKNGFRLDLLRRDAAGEVITRTAAEGGRDFDPAAEEKLIRDLSAMKVQQPDGTFLTQAGLYVEPLQLQVVCRGLWERMPEDDLHIDLADIEQFGDVTDALSGYYAGEVARIAGGDVRVERALREWCGDKLITRDGIRGQVLRGAGRSEGLENGLIASLVDTHLVRGEQRAGAVWYELAHDRLIEPVRENNRDWFDAHLHKVQKVATLWEAQGRPEGLLLPSEQLIEAKEWAAQNDSSLTPIERKFLEASSAKQEAIEKELRQARQLRLRSTIAVVVALIALLALGGALYSWNRAEKASIEAGRQRDEAKKQEALANQATRAARDQAHVAKAGELLTIDSTKAALLLLEVEEPDELGTAVTIKLLKALKHPFAIAEFKAHKSLLYTVDFSPDGKRLVTASQDGSAAVWDVAHQSLSQLLVIRPDDGNNFGTAAAFSENGSRIFTKTTFSNGKDYPSVEKTWLLENGEWIEVFERFSGLLGEGISGRELRNGNWVDLSGNDLKSSPSEMEAAFNRVNYYGQSEIIQKQIDSLKKHLIRPIPTFDLGVAIWPNNALHSTAPIDRIATLSTDFAARVWRIQANLNALVLPHPQPIADAKFSPDGMKVVSIAPNGMWWIWDLKDGKGSIAFHSKSLAGPPAESNSRNIATFSKDSKHVLTISSGMLRIFQTDRPDLSLRLETEGTGKAVNASFNNENEIIAVYQDWKARVWTLNGKIKAQYELSRPQNHGPIFEAMFSPDASTFLTVSSDQPNTQTIHRFWVGSAKGKFVYQKSNQPPEFLYDFRLDTDALLLGNRGVETVEIWDLEGKIKRNVLDIGGHAAASFSPLGDRLLITSVLKEARVWFSPDGGGEPVVLTQSPCKDFYDRNCLGSWSASFNQDGKQVITHEKARDNPGNGDVLIWDLDPTRLMSKVRAATPLCLDADFRRKNLSETADVAVSREKACRVCVPPFQEKHNKVSPEKNLESYRQCLKANGW